MATPCAPNPPPPTARLCEWCRRVPVKSRFCSVQCYGKARAQSNRNAPEPVRIPGARWIPLAGSGFALVDELDFEWLSRFSWSRGGSKRQYARTVLNTQKGVYMHQLLLPDVAEVDHKNGNGLDNRRENLREATLGRRSNMANMPSRSKATGYKGIALQANGKGWQARIRMPDGSRPSLGAFATQEEAARAYDDAARRVHGEFACVNFPRAGERGAR